MPLHPAINPSLMLPLPIANPLTLDTNALDCAALIPANARLPIEVRPFTVVPNQ